MRASFPSPNLPIGYCTRNGITTLGIRCLQDVPQRVFLSNYARYARNGKGRCRIATWRIKFVFGKRPFAVSGVSSRLKTRAFTSFRLGKESLATS